MTFLMSFLGASLEDRQKAASSNSEKVREQVGACNVETDECKHDAEISPPVVVEDVEVICEVLVTGLDGTEGARCQRFRVGEVAADSGYEWSHVLSTGLPTWRIQGDEFDCRAPEFLLPDSLTKQTLNEVGERRQVIHPLPPAELREGLQNTVKCDDKRE